MVRKSAVVPAPRRLGFVLGVRETKRIEANDTFIQQESALLPYRHWAMKSRRGVLHKSPSIQSNRIQSNTLESISFHFTCHGQWMRDELYRVCRYQLNRDTETLLGTEESNGLDGRTRVFCHARSPSKVSSGRYFRTAGRSMNGWSYLLACDESMEESTEALVD